VPNSQVREQRKTNEVNLPCQQQFETRGVRSANEDDNENDDDTEDEDDSDWDDGEDDIHEKSKPNIIVSEFVECDDDVLLLKENDAVLDPSGLAGDTSIDWTIQKW
jgi:hypothetical protein